MKSPGEQGIPQFPEGLANPTNGKQVVHNKHGKQLPRRACDANNVRSNSSPSSCIRPAMRPRIAFVKPVADCVAIELLQLTPAQLRQAADLKEKIAELEGELASILGGPEMGAPSPKLHWTQTSAGRARLARSLRRSWRSRRSSSKPKATPASGNGKTVHWTQTPAGRAKMAKLMARRWKTRRMAAA